jgi:hypothetical protein
MFTRKTMWNDGPPLLDFMGREGAPAVATKHLCFGGGGGNTVGPGPDYSQYIAEMTKFGEKGQGWADDLFNWAKNLGVNLQNLAGVVSGKAGAAADTAQARADKAWGEYDQYGNIRAAQRADAERMYSDLPGTEEHYAGKFGADTSQAMDQAQASVMRDMRSKGFAPSAIATGAIGTTAALQRAAAVTAAGETGRMQARTEARNVGQAAINTGATIPGVAATEEGVATANRNQQVNAPLAAASTSAGLYSPSLGFYSAALPYMKEWGDTMKTQRSQDIQAAQVNAQNDDGGFMSTILPLAGGIAGSYFGPMGSAIGSSMGKAIGSKMTAAGGGRIPRGRRYAGGGAIDTSAPMNGGNYVPEEASPSNGAAVDDVPAMVSAGEFVIPKRTVDWLGDKFFQKLIQKTDAEIDQDTTAAPEESQDQPPDMHPGAIDMQPPMFRSEGARV